MPPSFNSSSTTRWLLISLVILAVLSRGIALTLGLLISLSVHEFAHAIVAGWLGDDTARRSGRLTLNPLKHLDPLGTSSLLLFGFGWGKPVPFNPLNLRHPRRDAGIVSVAGPLSSLLLALSLAFLLKFYPLPYFYSLAQLNLVFGFFNLLPIHPLDGFKIVLGFLPRALASDWLDVQSFGPYILLFLVFSGLLFKIINPLVTITSYYIF